MSEQEQERHETDESTDEPDVEAHLADTLDREEVFTERELTDSLDERQREDVL